MKPIELSVRCTREEYMTFAAKSGKPHPWTVAVGFVMIVLGVMSAVFSRSVTPSVSLCWYIGVLLWIADPLLLPMRRKGNAGRLYDRSDYLQGAVALRFSDDSVYVRSANVEATVPWRLMTDVLVTDNMTALVFGKELSVYLPHRALSDEERNSLTAKLAEIMKKDSEL